jgi:alpha-galactosidase
MSTAPTGSEQNAMNKNPSRGNNRKKKNTIPSSPARDSTPEADWSDIHLQPGDEPLLTYRSGMAVYEESLTKNRFVGRGWSGSGFVRFYNIWDCRLDPAEHPAPQAFWLEIDGQLLASDWEWDGFEKRREPGGPLHGTVTLKHRVRPVTVKVHTQLDGTPVLCRWMEITNTGERPAALAECGVWSGVLQQTRRWRDLLEGTGKPLYSLGYFENTRACNEGDFQWHDLPAAACRVDGHYRRDRHRHPWFILRNNAKGETFIGQLAWSGGYSFEFDLDADTDARDPVRGSTAQLFFRGGPDAPAPQRVIAPGETIRTPEMHMGLVFGEMDAAVHAMHDHFRRSVFLPQARGRGGWVESGIGPEVEITPEQVVHAIDAAADIGAEVFFVDASWYSPPHGDWWKTAGDWKVDRKRFPMGLESFRDRVHKKGMLWGLWMDPERIGPESEAARRRPEWLARGYDGEAVMTRYAGKPIPAWLDLADPRIATWMEEQIVRVIKENKLDFFRLDFNVGNPGMGPRTLRNGYVENGYWRYYEAVYAIFARLRKRFPDVIFENCASGGSRTDIGLTRYFCHTWVSDWQIAPRSFAITNGMTMALPPEYVVNMVGCIAAFTTADLDFQLRRLLFGPPTLMDLKPPGMEWNPQMLARLRRVLKQYKEFVRPMLPTARVYHHTPVVAGPESKGWGVLELASADRTRAICGIFQLAAPRQDEYLLRFRGLDPSRRYRVTFDNSDRTAEMDGAGLMYRGLSVRLEGALTSELLLVETAR